MEDKLLREKRKSVEKEALSEDLCRIVVFKAVTERWDVAEDEPASVIDLVVVFFSARVRAVFRSFKIPEID